MLLSGLLPMLALAAVVHDLHLYSHNKRRDQDRSCCAVLCCAVLCCAVLCCAGVCCAVRVLSYAMVNMLCCARYAAVCCALHGDKASALLCCGLSDVTV